ncbi:hypothetical protein GWK47_029085 [Chionoecetes opilio]|uniref:Uncharacterized protein n=1 Tax=Chionoecetes opilio TaxID=41210 RepID=A0A8J5D269_CHIOP|nr:hypothetical protein GWK47_029085 [Chionoecetes opilio]
MMVDIRASGPVEEQRDGVAIREKARSIYDHLAEKEPSGSSPDPGFIAAMGWFHRIQAAFRPAQHIRSHRQSLLVDNAGGHTHRHLTWTIRMLRFLPSPRTTSMLQRGTWV